GGLPPDGKWAVLPQVERPEIFSLVPTGPGEARTLAAGGVTKRTRPAFFPDGKRIAFAGVEPGHSWRVYVQDLDGLPRAISREGLVLESSRAVSPDGRRIVAEDATHEPVILTVATGELSPMPGIRAEERVVQWASDHELYAFNGATIPCRVFRIDPTSGRRDLVREIVPSVAAPLGVRALFMTPDGASYAYSMGATVSDLYVA